MNYVDEIDARIMALQREISRLTIARDVIVELASGVREPRKVMQERLSAPKVLRRRRRQGATREAIDKVFAFLKDKGEPIKPVEILRAFGIGPNDDKTKKKGFYNALVRMMQDGTVVKDERGRYRLPHSDPPKSSEEAA